MMTAALRICLYLALWAKRRWGTRSQHAMTSLVNAIAWDTTVSLLHRLLALLREQQSLGHLHIQESSVAFTCSSIAFITWKELTSLAYRLTQ